ncbi:uncharacterized protein [Diabrotica undecimpunctata]
MSESLSKQYFLAAINLEYKNEYEFESGTDCFNFIEREFGLNPFQENSIEVNEGYAATSNNKQNFADYQNQINCDCEFTNAKDDGVSQQIYNNSQFKCYDKNVENTEITKGYIALTTTKENMSDYPNQIGSIKIENDYIPLDKRNISESVCKKNMADYSNLIHPIKIENNYISEYEENISESVYKENISDYPIKIENNDIPQDKANISGSVYNENILDYPIKIENKYIPQDEENITESMYKENILDSIKIENNYMPQDKENISGSVCNENTFEYPNQIPPIKIENNYIPQDEENISESVCKQNILDYPIKTENNYILPDKEDISESVCKENMSDYPNQIPSIKIENNYIPQDKENISESVSSLHYPKSWTDYFTDCKKIDANKIEIIFESSKNEQIQMKNDRQIQIKHSDDKSLKLNCRVCKKDFFSYEDTVNHLNSHQGQHICQFCGKSFTQKEDLIQHCTLHITRAPCSNQHDLKDSKEHKQFKCNICSLEFDEKMYLNIHLKLTHFTMCSICNKVVKNTNFRKHYLSHETLQCSICFITFNTISNARRHWKTMHPNSKIKAIYPLSNMVSKENRTYTQCPICKVIYNNVSNVRKHLKQSHNIYMDEANSHICGQKCSKVHNIFI